MNCKPVDMAIVIRFPDVDPRGFMAPVTVLRAARPMCPVQSGGQEMPAWIVRSDKPFLVRRYRNEPGRLANEFAVPDAYLRRIDPPADDEHDQAEAGKPEQVAA